MSRAARLGAFIVATLAILAAGIFIIGDRQYLFSSTYRLKTQFSTVVGLDAGAEVRVGGLHSGTVRGIELPKTPAGKITVLMDLQRSTHDIVKPRFGRRDPDRGLLGNEYVSISFGSAEGADVRDGDTISSEPPLAIADLMKKTDAILDSSQVAVANTAAATASLKSISAKIDDGKGTIGALVNDKTMLYRLEPNHGSNARRDGPCASGHRRLPGKHGSAEAEFPPARLFKKRGYEDSSDLAKDAILHLPEGSPLKTFTYEPKRLSTRSTRPS